VPLLAERVRARETLANKQVGTRTAYLELKQQLVEMQGDLRIARVTLEEGAQSIKAQQDKRNELLASFSAATHDELSKALQRAGALEKELAKAEERHRLKTLRAPTDGFVQQLAVHTVGGVVNPGDPLMVVVPHDTVVEIEAQILNKDIGFVRAGQVAAIKVESFLFTKYGLINGEVLNVSADAVQDKDRGLIYAARIAMKEKRMLVGDKWVNLVPGMAVTVEIKTGERRIVEYFLSPFLRYADEAMRER
jgi:hemolysin D